MGQLRVQSPRKLSNADIALAMELRSIGISLRHIATGLGVTRRTVASSIQYAEIFGMGKPKKPAVISPVRLRLVSARAAKALGFRL